MHEVQNVVPTNSIEILGNVELDEEGQGMTALEPMGCVRDVHKIVVDAPSLDESVLAAGDNIVHVWT
jgi:hypothetical protein